MNLRLRWYGLGTPLGPDKMAVGGWGMWTCWLRGGRGAVSRYVLALWKEASEYDCTRHSQALVAKVSFSHEGLHGDWLARCFFTTESDLQKRQTVRNNGESDNQRTSSSRKPNLGCRMLLLSPNDTASQY